MEAFVVLGILLVFIFAVYRVFSDKKSRSEGESSQYFKNPTGNNSGDDISVISLPEARILARTFEVGRRYLIEYTDSSGNDSQREITVRSIDGLMVKAVCHRRRQVRTFRADRMSIVVDIETGEALL